MAAVIRGNSADERERDCGNRTCACPHTDCRAGWSDDEEIVVRHGVDYPTVKRCTWCAEAVVMAAELKPKRGKHR